MSELLKLDWNQLGANAITAIGMIVFAYLMLQAAKLVVEMIQKQVSAMTEAYGRMVNTLNETMTNQRSYHAAKMDEMRGEIRRLEERVHDFEEQLEEKNQRIEELERENKRLHLEIDLLKESVENEKTKNRARKPAPRRKAA